MNVFVAEKTTEAGGTPNGASVHLLDDDCKGNWRTPSDCTPKKRNCEYYIEWATIGRGDEMHFHIETNRTNTWTGVGFSDDQKMVRSIKFKGS